MAKQFDPPVLYTAKNSPFLQSAGVVPLAWTKTQDLHAMREFLFNYNPEFADYVEDVPPPEMEVEMVSKVAGQLCYLSFGPNRTLNLSAHKYFENIKGQGHGSVLEHSSASLLLYGISRTMSHELVRHRHMSFSQVSQRYVDGDMVRFVERPEFIEDKWLHEMFEREIDGAFHSYNAFAEVLADIRYKGATKTREIRKAVNQTARTVLPGCTEAPMVVSANFRAWRYFLNLRGTIYAETEIRNLALLVLEVLQSIAPLTFSDFYTEIGEDGESTVIRSPYGRV